MCYSTKFKSFHQLNRPLVQKSSVISSKQNLIQVIRSLTGGTYFYRANQSSWYACCWQIERNIHWQSHRGRSYCSIYTHAVPASIFGLMSCVLDNNNWLFRVQLFHRVRDFENACGSLWRLTTFQIMSPSSSVILKKQKVHF